MFQIADRRLLIADFGCARAVVGSMSKPISKPQALQQRLISHAAVLLEISANLPHTPQATHVSRQLLRSGTAAAANTVKRGALKAGRTLFTSSELC
jgi:L-aminopeptidase/D-esterase-like protein